MCELIFNKLNKFNLKFLFTASGVLLVTAGLSACGKGSLSADSGGSHQVVNSCSESIQGSPWSVQVAGISPANHDSTTSLSQVVINKTGPLVGLGQAAPAGKEISVTIDMGQDLGQWGSLTLMAKVTQMPGSLAGSAFAYLVSLNDGVNELVNLTRDRKSTRLTPVT